ncbi:MAG: elongation factor P [Planctomycetota bacterium]
MALELKKNQCILVDGDPHVVLDVWTTGTAQRKRTVHARIRSVKTHRVVERSFTDIERIEVRELETKNLQYLYQSGKTFSFMDQQSFETYELPETLIGESQWALKEGENYLVRYFEGLPVDIVVPPSVIMRVTGTAPPVKRSEGGNVRKEATLEAGITVMVPQFISEGDLIKVDTRTREYIGKESE